MRLKSRRKTWAKERAISVLARPGKSSIKTWPSLRTPRSTSSSAWRLPTTARSTSSRMRSARAPTSVRVYCSDSTDLLHGAADTGQIESARPTVLGLRPVGPHQLPGIEPQERPRALRLAVRRHPTQRQPVSGDAAQVWAEPVVDVKRRAQREIDGVLELLECPCAFTARSAPPAPTHPQGRSVFDRPAG